MRTAARAMLRALIAPVAITGCFGAGIGIGHLIAPDPAITFTTPTAPPPLPTEVMERYGCSVTGLDKDTIPAHALVRRDGHVSLTSFDDGWATYRGERPGVLVAVCAR